MNYTKFVVAALTVFAISDVATAQQATKAAGLNDAQIAAIVVAANGIDADLGDLAAERAKSEAIRQFGKTMATDHRAVNKAAGELVAKLKVTPLENSVSEKLRADAAAFRAELLKKSGTEFDRAYITHEVEYHKAVIGAVDAALIPNASNEELKATLVSVRPALEAHLKHAEHLLADLK